MGVNFYKNEIFFTLNGDILESIENPLKSKILMPTVGLHSLN